MFELTVSVWNCEEEMVYITKVVGQSPRIDLYFKGNPRILELAGGLLKTVFSNCGCHPLLGHKISIVSHL